MYVTGINRYFWPENLLVIYISRWLVADGHDVRVFTGHPDDNPARPHCDTADLPLPKIAREKWLRLFRKMEKHDA